MNTDIQTIHSSEPYDPDGYANDAIAISDTDIAIVGMAGCFPGAASVDEFWCNLRDGKEAVQFFSDEELAEAGVPSLLFNNPAYVKAGAVLEDIEYFDANFFGFSPREAEIMDPQHRLFLEQAWSVLEHAGYSTDQYEGAIAVYAGVGVNDYLLSCLYPHLQQAGSSMGYQAIIRNDKDFLPTLASYKLNLKGPSVSVQTACSTSLVAVHMACQSLLNGECDMALAGGSAISVDQKQGYLYEEGMIMSPDGHCRAFDAKAQGTVGGSAVATVLLKRLADAVDDGDTIHAVIKGSAINNDGDDKVGYTAPSVTGQAAVIAEAQAIAGVDPSTISYVEAHGTGTILGDPIELSALTQAFQSDADESEETHPPQSPLGKGGSSSGPPPYLSQSVSVGRKGVRGGDVATQYCAIGSLKTNVGHLDTAAGVAGLIKTALSLKHQHIPPSLHFDEPNPAINFTDSPFFVNTQLTPWQRNGTPRRAGVSAFGIGGTNAHAVLEEAPPRSPSGPSRSLQLLTLSAKTSTALATIANNLSEHLSKELQSDPDLSLADVAYTLNRGRKGLECRQTVVTGTVQEAIAHLQTLSQSSTAPTRVLDGLSVAFMFSGQGSQYVNMGRELYDTEPLFQDTIDQCADHLLPILGQDIRDILYPPATASEKQLEQCRQQLQQTAIAQPALFIVEYALAQLWMTWGVQPQMMIGHSIGEYVAACLAGVFSLEDALTLVAKRGQLMQSLPAGSMMAIALPVEDVTPRLKSYPDLSLATVNGPSCVVSGPTDSIEALHQALTQGPEADASIQCHLLHTSHGFHSAMMEPILPLFTQAVQSITLSPPTRPYISNVTGTWITEDQATAPDYWAQHLRQTVHFAPGLAQILQDPAVALLEVGPGKTLSRFSQQHPALEKNHRVFTSLRHPKETTGDLTMVLKTLGQLWAVGASVDWQAVYKDEQRHRLPLPTYPFERQRYWIDAPDASERAMGTGFNLQNFATVPRKPNPTEWLYVPSWQRSPLPSLPPNTSNNGDRWLVFQDPWGVMAKLVKRLEQSGQQVWTVDIDSATKPGWSMFAQNAFTLNPNVSEGFGQLIQHLCDINQRPTRIVHGWSLTPLVDPSSTLDFRYTEQQQVLGLHTLLSLAKSLGKQASFPDTELITVVNGVHEVTGAEDLIPANSTAIAPTKVLPLEYPHLTCRSIDIELPQADIGLPHAISARLIDQLWSECLMSPDQAQDIQVAYRGPHRWVPTYAPLPTPFSEEPEKQAANETKQMLTPNLRLRPQGVYLITGGMGGIGLSLSQGLAKAVQARLILVKRSDFLPKEQWQPWLETHDESDETVQTIRRLQTIESDGGDVRVLAADVTHLAQMKRVVQTAESEFGAIDGVLHCAGLADLAGVVQGRTREATDRVLASKIQGTLVLQHIFNQRPLDFFLLSSSFNTTIYKALFGQVGYCAANDFLDAFAAYNTAVNHTFTVTVNWTAWLEVGMAAKAHATDVKTTGGLGDALPIDDIILGITPPEGQLVLQQILNQPHPRVVVSTQDLPRLLQQQAAFDPHEFLQQMALQEPDADAPRYPRPELSVDYVAPKTSLEILLAESWQGFLGLETVGIDDNFFDLGGDSLSSLGLITQLQHKLSIELPSNLLMEAPTISQLVNHLKQTYRDAIDHFFQSLETADASSDESRSEEAEDITTDETSALGLTPLNPPLSRGETPSPYQGEDRGGVVDTLQESPTSSENNLSTSNDSQRPIAPPPVSPEPSTSLDPSTLSLCLIRMRKGEPEQSPLFFAHPIGGGVACYTTLLRHLNPDRPFYGLRALGMDDDRPPHRDLKAMARDYIAAIKTVQPEGPYQIGGWSMGGVVAYEMAQQLGDEVASVVLVDSPAPVQQQNPAPLLTQLFVFGRSLGLADVQTRLAIGSERFQTLPLNEQLDRLLRQGVAVKVLPKAFELERMMQLFEVFQCNDYALKQYVAAQDITNAPMLFIRAQDSSSSITSDMDELGWQQLVNGQGSQSSQDRLQFTQSPGDHYSMVTKAHVQILGDRIETFLRSVRQRSALPKEVTPKGVPPQPLIPSVPLGMPSRDSGS